MSALSLEISAFAYDLHFGGFPRHISQAEGERLLSQLALLRRLATSLEQELAVHRLAEARGMRARALEQVATDALTDLVADPDGVVIRPDFGRT